MTTADNSIMDSGDKMSLGGYLSQWKIVFLDYLKKKDYVPLFHAASIVLIAIASLLLFYKSFSQSGILMHADMCWPTSMDRIGALYTHVWSPYGSNMNIWNIQRLFWVYPLLTVAKILNFSVSRYLLTQYIFTWWLAGVSMYCFAVFVMRSIKMKKASPVIVSSGALLAAIIYMYNPWCILHCWQYFLAPSYALLPLAFIFMVKSLESRSAGNTIILVFIMTLGSSCPIGVILLWIPLLAYAFFYVIINKFKREKLISSLKTAGSILVLYVPLNAMWILPYIQGQIAGKPFLPNYSTTISQAMIDILSAGTSISNNLRLLTGGVWGVSFILDNTLWKILSFALPIISIIALIALGKKAYRNRYILFWACVWPVSVVVATGSSSFLRRIYTYLFLEAPGSSLYGWVIRYPDRFLFFVPVFYALMAGLLLVILLSKSSSIRETAPGTEKRATSPGGQSSSEEEDSGSSRNLIKENRDLRAEVGEIKRKLGLFQSRTFASLAALVVITSMVSMVSVAGIYARRVYNPTRIPTDYEKVNKFVSEKGDSSRVIWMPFDNGIAWFSWSDGRPVGAFNVYSSAPSLNNFMETYKTNTYFSWLEGFFSMSSNSEIVLAENTGLLRDDAAALIMPFAADFLIVDHSKTGSDMDKKLESDKSLEKVFETQYLDVYRIKSGRPFISAASSTVKTGSYFDDLSIVRKVPDGDKERVVFINDNLEIDKKYGFIRLDNYKEIQNYNSEFEIWNDIWGPDGWTFWGDKSTSNISEDKDEALGGERCVRVENSSAGQYDVIWLSGNEIPASEGSMYTVESHIKYKNADWSQVVVEGFDTNKKDWVELVKCPNIKSGTSDWQTYESSFILPPGIDKIKLMLGAGWVKDAEKGSAVTWFDDVSISKIDDSFFAKLKTREKPPSVTYRKLSPEKYEIKVKGAKEPFVLSLSEAFDPHWIAEVSKGGKVEPIPLYSAINGFPINKTGDFSVTIEYESQKWFTLGLIISLATLALCLLYLLAYWYSKRPGTAEAAFSSLIGWASKLRYAIEMPPRNKRSG
ncbi:MAG: hypothetical protein JW738_04770 [Actinobacteria bacterium]|nr:hypothetical protein [Actinomycetota bacterium]